MLTKHVYCVDLTASSFTIDYTLDPALFPGLAIPASEMSMTTTSGGDGVLIMGLELVGAPPGQVLAVKLVPGTSPYYGTQYWDFSLPNASEAAPTQFPVLTNSSGTTPIQEIAFASIFSMTGRLYLYGN